MKKVTIFGMFAALMLANSCSDDNNVSQADSSLAQVTFKVSADGALTRAISDGTTVDELVYRVFDKNGNPITALPLVKPKSVIRISLFRTAKRNPLIFPI